MSKVPDDDYEGCGISPVATGKEDPFFDACAWHDKAYLDQSWAQRNKDRAEIDARFLDQMLLIAKGNWALIARAYLYYSLARAFGSRFWEGKR